MAPAHALSGALAGLGLAAALGHDTSALVRFLVVGVTCGSALLPDLDHPKSTASQSLAFATRLLAAGVQRIAIAVQAATRGPRDPRRHNGHRGITHTIPGCLVLGVAVGIVTRCGHWPAVVVLGLLCALGAAGAPVIGVTFTVVSHLVASQIPDVSSWWWLWLTAVTVGCVVHVAGDWITTGGVCVTFPLLRNGRRWKRHRLPALSFNAGSWPEHVLVMPALLAGCGWLVLVVFA